MSGGASRLRRFLGSVRGRFLWLFLLGMLVTLAAASALSYGAMHGAIGRFNQKSARAELSQIESNLQELSRELERQMSMLLLDSSTRVLMNEDVFTRLEFIEKAQEYSDKVDSLITNFPYVQSVYLCGGDGSFWATTKQNMRHFSAPWDPPASETMRGLVESASWALTMTGGVTSADFPIPEGGAPVPLVSVTKKYGSHIMICNILEQEIDTTYAGIATNPESRIRLLDTEGRVFSSADKSELLAPYPYFGELTAGQPGEITVAREAKQIFWQPVSKLGILVVNEVQLSAYWQEWADVRQVVFLTFFIGLGITCLLFFLWISRVFRPLDKLVHSMGRAGRGEYVPLPERRGADELSALIRHYNEMLDGMRELTEENRRVEEQKRDSELKALRSQINPHFLYNTLNTIKWMSLMEGNRAAADCITSLGKIIAPLFKSDRPTCSLREEVEIVEEYLEIMNVRCGGGIRLELQLGAGTGELPVLRFLLQPLVENSVVHGLAPRGYRGRVVIESAFEADCLVLRVSDDGEGMTEDAIAAENQALLRGDDVRGVGMMNTNRRLRLWYGPSYGVVLSPSPLGGLSVEARLPRPGPEAEKVDKG